METQVFGGSRNAMRPLSCASGPAAEAADRCPISSLGQSGERCQYLCFLHNSTDMEMSCSCQDISTSIEICERVLLRRLGGIDAADRRHEGVLHLRPRGLLVPSAKAPAERENGQRVTRLLARFTR